MRINILEAGLATFLMAGRGFLPREEEAPKRSPEMESWNSPVPPVQQKSVPKDESH